MLVAAALLLSVVSGAYLFTSDPHAAVPGLLRFSQGRRRRQGHRGDLRRPVIYRRLARRQRGADGRAARVSGRERRVRHRSLPPGHPRRRDSRARAGLAQLGRHGHGRRVSRRSSASPSIGPRPDAFRPSPAARASPSRASTSSRSRTSRASTRPRTRSRRSSTSCEEPGRFSASAGGFRRASCSSALREPARRCWRARSPARPACRSSSPAARISSRCMPASARRASAACSATPAATLLHRLHRRARRRRPQPRRQLAQPRRARADAQPAAGRDGRLRSAPRHRRHRRHQPAGHPRSGAAAPGPVRPPGDRRQPRSEGTRGDPPRPHAQDSGRSREPTCARSRAARPGSPAPTSPTWSTKPRSSPDAPAERPSPTPT